jgi:hypothetical protein
MATATKKTSDTAKSAELTAKKVIKKEDLGKVKTATTAKKATPKTPAIKNSDPATGTATEKKPARAPAAKKTATKKTAPLISPEHRYHMIATAAYYLAERRGFAGGYEMQDWISAEAEIDAKLKS